MSPAEIAAGRYARAEDKFRSKAALFEATGHKALAEGSKWYAALAHRAALAEIKDPVPVALRRVR